MLFQLRRQANFRLGRVTEISENDLKEIFSMLVQHRERHRTDWIGWLRAAALGANDGILSTANLVVGVAAAHSTASNILVAGVVGLVAGAMSMPAGVVARLTLAHSRFKIDLGGLVSLA